MRKLTLALLAAPLALAACADGLRLPSAQDAALKLSPKTEAAIEDICSAEFTTENMAAVNGYIGVYNFVAEQTGGKLPTIDVADYTSRELVVRLADARIKACDLYAAGKLFGAIE